MKITLTQSGIVSNVSCVFQNALATNNSAENTAISFYGNITPSGNCSIVTANENSTSNISSLGGLDTTNGLYVDIGNCSSVEVEII